MTFSTGIAAGLCQCGCGQRTNPDRTGAPRRFVLGHKLGQRGTSTAADRGYQTPCWIWDGAVNERGYGRAARGGAHRIAWERIHGPVPDGLELDHLCRQRDCVNPDHLEAVTHQENCRRAAIARASSEAAPDPYGVRAFRVQRHLSQSDVAKHLGVSKMLVSMWETGRHKMLPKYQHALAALEAEVA